MPAITRSTTCRRRALAERSRLLAQAGEMRVAVSLDARPARGLPTLRADIDAARAAGLGRHVPLSRHQDRHAGQALLRDAPPPSVLERRAHADRGHRVRARAARRSARARHHVRHQRPAGGRAAHLDQGLRLRRPLAADAAVRIVRLQERRPAGRRPGVRRALPAQSALRADAAAADRARRAGRGVPRGDSRSRAHVRATSTTSSRAGCPTTRATTATT